MREQGAADRHPLRLAAGKIARAPAQQRPDAQQIDHRVEAEAHRGIPPMPPIAQVAAHIQVRKQPGVLEYIANAAAMGGHVDPVRAVEQHPAIHFDMAGHGCDQPGDGVEHGGLADAGRTGQRQYPRIRMDAHATMERTAPEFGIQSQHHASSRPRWRRVSHSESSSATSEMAIATIASRQMPASPPGTCISP